MRRVSNISLRLEVGPISHRAAGVDGRGLARGAVGVNLLLVQHFHFLCVSLALHIVAALRILIVACHTILVIPRLTIDVNTG